MADACTIVVDRRAYEVETSEGTARARHGDLVVELPAWSGARHLAALRRHLVPGAAGLELDGEGYAAEVLALTEAPVERWSELVPLALWWATRPELDPAPAPHGDDVALHRGAQARLRECAWQQRLAAARGGLVRSDEGAAVDPVRVLEQLLASAVERVEAPPRGGIAIEALDGSSLVRLSSLVLDRSCREAPFDELMGLDDAPEPARGLLELCRVLGRTPSQVLQMPATEVDLVRELLRRIEGEKLPRRPVPSRPHAPLHDAPDAVVIRFGDEGKP